MSTNLQFPDAISSYVLEIMSTLVCIMITIRSGFRLTPIRMTLNDPERPIHLKVRLADGTLDVQGIHVMAFRPDNEGSNGAISSTINFKMEAAAILKNFKWPYFCNALSASLYVCTQTIHFVFGRCKVDAYEIRHYLAREGNKSTSCTCIIKRKNETADLEK